MREEEKRVLAIIVVVLTAFTGYYFTRTETTQSNSHTFIFQDKVGDWEIKTDDGRNNACFAVVYYGSDADRTIMRIGYDLKNSSSEASQGFHLVLIHKGWPIERSTRHYYRLQFDNGGAGNISYLQGQASSVIDSAGEPGLIVNFGNETADTFYERLFAKSHLLHFRFDNIDLPPFELSDIETLIPRLRTCEDRAWQVATTNRRQQLRDSITSGSINDEQNDPDFRRYCRNPIYRIRPGDQTNNGASPQKYYNAIKLLYARRKWYDEATNREFFKILIAAIEVDNLHYQLGIVQCYLPIEGKGVEFLWGTNPWKDDFVGALEGKYLGNLVSDGWFRYPPYATSVLPK